ncbi:hypothetical protein [Allocoleopsis sp.]|uniref:hypothetical protein n=1 Tax=Allocoleopsis sp. TaxID=3088169 RepID=UPI002FD48E51
MDISATLNEILLPPFLLLIVFCMMCCQLPRHSATVSTTTESSVETERGTVETLHGDIEAEQEFTTAIEASLCIEDSVEDLAPPSSAENVPVEKATSLAVMKTVTPELYAQTVAVIDKLNKVSARKLCKPLKIQQKRNGVELTKELMLANIKRVLKTEPELVISTISEKLNIDIVATMEDSLGNESIQIA